MADPARGVAIADAEGVTVEHLDQEDLRTIFAAGVVLRTLGRSRLSERAGAMGERLRSGLEGLAAGGAPIHDVRGVGLLVGVDVGPPAGDVVRACLDHGLLVNAIGDDTIRLAPPLIVASAEVDRGVELLGRALVDAGQGGTRGPELDDTSDESHRDASHTTRKRQDR